MKIVVGMHRSGTSLLMNLLQRAGADLGDESGFHPGDRWNPDGYFEQREILAANRSLLHGSLGRLAFFLPPSERTILIRAGRVRKQLQEISARYTDRLVKDPRFLFTGPAWERHGTVFTHVLISLREPADVLRSMQRRNRLPTFLLMRMMADHYRRLLIFADRYPSHYVWYDHLVAGRTCLPEFSSAAQFLGLPFCEEKDAVWLKSVVRLRSPEPEATTADYGSPVKELWAELCERHLSQNLSP